MTGPTTLTTAPQILVDDWPNDVVKSTAWVEITGKTRSPLLAVRWLESRLPLEDRPEDERYFCSGKREWWEPEPTEPPVDPAEGPWTECAAGTHARNCKPGAREFWVLNIVCPT